MDKRQKERLKKKRMQDVYREQKRIEFLREIKPLVPQGAVSRSCGECQACCEVIAIGEGTPQHKPNYVRCEHQCEKGCGIYSTRPSECKTYYCLWQAGILTGGDEMRPDRLGVLLDFRAAHGNKSGQVRECCVFWETRAGGLDEPAVKKLIREVREMGIEVAYNEYRKVFPDDDRVIQFRFKKSLL